MTPFNKSIFAALVGAIALLGAASFADAGPHHGSRGWRHGGYGPGPCYAMQDVSPEQRQMVEDAYSAIAPLQLELRAKRQELTAKIYGGADDKTIQTVADQVKALEARLSEARLGMQKNFAKAGMPMHMGRGGGCPGYGPGHMRHGYNCPGYGHGPMRHGFGCPGYGYGPGAMDPRSGAMGDNIDGPAGQSAE